MSLILTKRPKPQPPFPLSILPHHGHSRTAPLIIDTILTRPFSLNLGRNVLWCSSPIPSRSLAWNSTSRVCLDPETRSLSAIPQTISSNSVQWGVGWGGTQLKVGISTTTSFRKLREVMDDMRRCSSSRGYIAVISNWRSSRKRERSGVVPPSK